MSEIEGGGGGSVEGGGSGEVSSSSEVSETSAAETGGESSEATQEAATEEAGESGGFDEDTDTTESPEDSAEEYDESDSEGEPDDSQEVGFSEGNDVENTDSQYDGSDYENDDTSSGDEDGVGFDDSDEESLDDNDSDDVQDDGEAEAEDADSTADDDEADGDMDNNGEPDGSEADNETDTENGDNIDDVQDDGEVQTEDTDSNTDGDEADGDMDNDGEPDGSEADTEADTEDGDDTDDYDEEDPGELEDYSDDDSENRNEEDESTDGSNSEREQEEEEQAAEEENQKAAERAEDEAENADVHNADNNVDDAAESENRNPSENGTEQQNEPAETESTQTVDTENEAPRNDTEVQNDSADNKTDSSTDTRDQNEEQPDDTNSRMENKAETPEGEDAYRTAMNNMAEYMSEHNYGPDDYAEYSKDPEWYKLNSELQQSLGMDVTTDVSTPSPESGKDVFATELPDNCVIVNASDIDMTYAQGMDSDQFWNHHGNTKEDYMRIAEGIPDVQQALDSGKSLDEIKQDPDLKDTAHAYFDPENMIKVEQQADGSYSFADDGRHRIAAAQELGYEIPVQVTNLPENANASAADMKPEGTATPEDVANKSDISSETRENLGAFEQNNWDNLSQVEKEQAVEILRDSIAEDLQLENKPNIAYYNNEDPGDHGGYAASNNTIYINRFNMGDAAETADTVAHESRHCWQHERADNPQTEQDQQFKENFDDYTRPEDNFEEYLNQPVEQDARDYAEQVRDLIPQEEAKDNTSSVSDSGEGDADNSTENPRAPPEGDYQSENISELPADFESKNVSSHYEKLGNIGKEAFDGSSSIESADGSYKELSSTEREQLSSKCKELINSIPKEDRGDFRVPEPEKIKGVTSEGRIVEAWKPNTDGAVEGTRHMETPMKGQIIDRVGGETGNYFSPMDENGKPYSLKSRAIGDYLPEENISDNSSYHAYEVQQDFTKENFQNAINNSDLEDADKEKWLKRLDAYYDDCTDATVKDHVGDVYADNSSEADGVKTGKIAPMFKSDDGGATQYITPFSAAELKEIKMIKDA